MHTLDRDVPAMMSPPLGMPSWGYNILVRCRVFLRLATSGLLEKKKTKTISSLKSRALGQYTRPRTSYGVYYFFSAAYSGRHLVLFLFFPRPYRDARTPPVIFPPTAPVISLNPSTGHLNLLLEDPTQSINTVSIHR